MRTFFVTGASTGIGEAIAVHFARRGDRVYATMRTPDKSAQAISKLAMEEGLDLRILALDVTDPASIEAAVHVAQSESGKIDVLVNNAGIAMLGTVEEAPAEWLTTTLDTNVVGVVRVVQAVVPAMRQRGSGVIVNVSSVSGRLASPGVSHYSASKHALEALSESLASELLPFGVRVIVVQPGFISTPLVGKLRVPDGSLNGPYRALMKRQVEFFQEGVGNADPPSVVAQVLQAALEDPSPRLRYLAGQSAAPSMEYRASVSDEEWVGMVADRPG